MMKTLRRTLAATALIVGCTEVHAQGSSSAALGGVSAFVVDAQAQDPFDDDVVRAIVESSLKSATINTITSGRFAQTPGAAGLRVSLSLARERDESCVAGMILVEVVERGTRVRVPDSVSPVVTWRNGAVWLSSSEEEMSTPAEKALRAALAKLINAYQSANAK
jgi:nucleotide-binding universal stress UspA family protein